MLDPQEFLELFPGNIIVSGSLATGKLSRITHNISIDEAEMKNTLAHKQDIYFTPNGDYKSFFGDSKAKAGRSKANAKTIYAFIVDIDNTSKSWTELHGIEPSVVIKTKNGHHVYYLFENPVDTKNNLTKWENTQMKLCDIVGGDEKAKDISRILRVPGFLYWKDNLGETEIKVHSYSRNRYIFEDFCNKVDVLYETIGADKIEEKQIMKKAKTRTHKQYLSSIFSDISSISVLEVLNRLYPHFTIEVSGAIKHSGEMTKGYKYNRVGNYINNFSNDDLDTRPRGGPYSIAKQYYKNPKEIFEFFNKEFQIKTEWIDFSYDNLIQNEEKELKHQQTEKIAYGDAANGIIIDKVNMNIRGYSEEKGERVFVNGLVESKGVINMPDNTRKFVVEISQKKKEGGIFTAITTLPVTGTATDMRKFLLRYGLMCGDSRIWFEKLLNYLLENKTNISYANKLGYQILDDKKVIIDSSGVFFDEGKNIYVDISDVPDGKKIEKGSAKCDINSVMESLCLGYDGNIIIPVFLSLILGINSFYFRSNRIAIPQLFLLGLSGTGKTTVLNELFRMFGLPLELSSQSTPFIYENYARHFLPIHFSEYRNGSNKYASFIEGFVRSLFDGTESGKGNQDQKTNRYEANAQYCFDGQTTFVDDAALTRTIFTMSGMRAKGDIKQIKKISGLYTWAVEIFSGESDFLEYIKLVNEKILYIKTLPLKRRSDRLITNYAYLLALNEVLGCKRFDKYVESALIYNDGFVIKDDIKMIYQKVLNLQMLHRFDMTVSDGGFVVNIIEEGLRFNINTDDLSGFIKTVNAHFLGANDLSGMQVYVDMKYITENSDLWGFFVRVIGTISRDRTTYTEEEKRTIQVMNVWLDKNFKHNPYKVEFEMEEKFGTKKDKKIEMEF